MITTDEARRRIGAAVVYRPPEVGADDEYGVIVGVASNGMIYVRYRGDEFTKATNPENLRLDPWVVDLGQAVATPEQQVIFAARDADGCHITFIDNDGDGIIVNARDHEAKTAPVLVALDEPMVLELTRALTNRIPVREAAS